MGAVLDTVTFQTTAPGATFTAATPATGDSLTVRNTALTDPIFLLNHWVWNHNLGGTTRIRSPKLHDNVQGIRREVILGQVDFTESLVLPQRLWPQDTLIVEMTGDTTAGYIDIGSMLIYYANFPGIAATLIDLPTLQKNVINLFSNIVSITSGTTGGYSGAAAINSTEDLFIANTWYAVLGMIVNARVASVCLRGPDTGNLRASVPGEPGKQDVYARWFPLLTAWYGIPLIPCFNSANKASTFIDVVANDLSATPSVNVMMAQLAGVT